MTVRSDVRWGCVSTALCLWFVCVLTAQTENRAGVIGLLTLPQFSDGLYCQEQPTRHEVPLYARA